MTTFPAAASVADARYAAAAAAGERAPSEQTEIGFTADPDGSGSRNLTCGTT